MNKNLPKIFQNKDIKNNTNDKYVYGNIMNKKEVMNVQEQLNKIFNSNKHICGINVEITTNNKTSNEKIIAKTQEYLLTKNNKKIFIRDIKNIIEK